MKLTVTQNKIKIWIAAVACGLVAQACDSMIYEDQGDCSPKYRVKFEYRHHLKGGDAFTDEVDAVTLYLTDMMGKVVWQKTESGERLASDGYTMEVDVEPGNYSLLAWCGSGVGNHFTINDATSRSDLHCYQTRSRDENDRAVSSQPLGDLYHGRLDNQTFPDDEGTHSFTVQLVKNTNDISIILQQLSGKPLDKSQYEFTITDRNGWLGWDNEPLEDEEIDYRPHTTTLMGAEIADVTNGYSHSYGALRAEHTTSRLIAPKGDDSEGSLWLTVRHLGYSASDARASGDATDREDKTIIHIPLTSYCLAFKTARHSDLTDQEYLDRADDYNMVFFVDEYNTWIDAFIYVNNFRIVKQSSDL